MLVVGFNWPPAHDNTIAAILDGRLIFASEEERYTRHKHSLMEPSFRSLVSLYKFLKTNYSLTPSDVDAYAINFDPKFFSYTQRHVYSFLTINRFFNSDMYKNRRRHFINPYRIVIEMFMSSAFIYSNYIKYAEVLVKTAADEANFPVPSKIKIYPVRHHLAHAASAYYFSGFNSAAAIIVDAAGEREATTIWKIKGGEFEPLLSIPANQGSIGHLWEGISENLGYEPLEGSGKLMGLAPYGVGGRFLSKFYEIFELEDRDYPYKLKDKYKKGLSINWNINMHKLIADYITGGEIKWNPGGQLDRDAVDIAHDLQAFTDQVMLRIGEWTKNNANENNIVLREGSR